MDLFFFVSEKLGMTSDRDIAELAGVSTETVANWRCGSVQEFKPQKLAGIKERLGNHLDTLHEQLGLVDQQMRRKLSPIEIETGSGPADLQRKFRDCVAYDYLGHRFLYYEPMGALAWENLIKRGYEQDRWLGGVRRCVEQWFDISSDSSGRCQGVVAESLGLRKKLPAKGFDLISLGPGEGHKELEILRRLLSIEKENGERPLWMSFSPVDVSIPLLLTAARGARDIFGMHAEQTGKPAYQVRPVCADFEEGELSFLSHLPTSRPSQAGIRLVLALGNVFGNLRDEETFVREKLWALTRPGDLVWLELGLRLEPITKDPLYRLTLPDQAESASDANRRLLLEGPYRRWEAAAGRRPGQLDMRVWAREDDESCRVPGALNFCHDLVLKDERRVITMLYSRRYNLEKLVGWFESLKFSCERILRVEDSRHQSRVAHLLLRRH